MNELYERIAALCSQRDIKPGRMCNDLGISRGNITDLKMGRIESLSSDKLSKISKYFGVTVDYLLTGEQKVKAPTLTDEREIGMDDFEYAFNGEVKELTESDKQLLLSMARQLNEARKQRDGKKTD